MKRLILAAIVILLLTLFVKAHGFTWYAAGTTDDWPHTFNGGKAEIIQPFYKTPSNSYTTNSQITIHFRIENPENNLYPLQHNVYLKLWKVISANIYDDTISENDLYEKHALQQDTQIPYKTITLGPLLVQPGQNSEFSSTFSVPDPGFYQFDLTDLSESEEFVPGHIYAAGFLKVIPQPNIIQGVKSNVFPLWLIILLFLASIFLVLFVILKGLYHGKKDKLPIPHLTTY